MLDRTLSAITSTTGRSTEAAASALLEGNPLGRFVRPDEVANVVVWLCRPESDAVTGQAIVIDGGQVQH
jgi:NAD(P)-dependent dehydrogenase (short-subunit alcohol dehydrogenase family)